MEKYSIIVKHVNLKVIAEVRCFKGCIVFFYICAIYAMKKNIVKVDADPVFGMFSYFIFSENLKWGSVPLTWCNGIYD